MRANFLAARNTEMGRPMATLLRFYTFSLIFTVICLGLGAWYGWVSTGTVTGTLALLWIIVVLSVLEVSLSFDNAVVNAAVLKDMDEVWQKRFLTWGIAFAVFGMRIVFPLAIVAIAAGLGPIETVNLSLNDPERYEEIVSGAHALPAAEIAILLLVMWGISTMLAEDEALTFLVAGILGLVTFIAVEGVNKILELKEEAARMQGAVVRSGLGGFLYLNVLDASFSFDGVIGAFALSNNMIVIALGLSIGAMFVRSMTIHLVKQGTLAQYRFLENGAFWAIIVLGGIMLFSAVAHIPETITGLIGAILIFLSLWWSIRHNRREQDLNPEAPLAE